MQTRSWNWKDDDYTLIMNQRDGFFRRPGRFAGFDFKEVSGFNLTLYHDITGLRRVPLTHSAADDVGVWVTHQGVQIVEDGDITLPISQNQSPFPRIDIIVGSHEYVELTGGVVASYSVVAGTPQINPAAPVVVNNTKDVILGTLYVPGLNIDLSNAVWSPASIPNFAGDSSISHLDRDQTHEAYQAHRSGYSPYYDAVQGSYRRDTKVLTLPSYEAGDGKDYPYAGYKIFEDAATSGPGYGTVESILCECETIPVGFEIDIFCVTPTRFQGSNFDHNLNCNFEWVTLKKGVASNQWDILSGRVLTAKRAVMESALVLNTQDVTLSNNIFSVTESAWVSNIFKYTASTAAEVRYLSTHNWRLDPSNDKSNYHGAFVVLECDQLSGQALTIVHNHGTSTSSIKPFWTPLESDLILERDTTLILVETDTHWKVVGVQRRESEIISIIENSVLHTSSWITLSPEGSTGYSNNSLKPAAYRVVKDRVSLRGVVDIDASAYWATVTAGIAQTTLMSSSLPTNARPTTDLEFNVSLVRTNYPEDATIQPAKVTLSTAGSWSLSAVAQFTGDWKLVLDGLSYDKN